MWQNTSQQAARDRGVQHLLRRAPTQSTAQEGVVSLLYMFCAPAIKDI